MNTFVSRLGGAVLRLLLLALVVVGTGALVGSMFLPSAMAVADVVDTVQREIFDVPPMPDTEPLVENSFVYAADGSEIAEINYEESRIPVALSDIPAVMVNAVIATEDSDFWSHNGVNFGAIARTAVRNLRAGDIEGGASTITQQYVKNTYIAADRRTEQSYNRKIQEALWAIELERRMSKEDILEGYLNRSYFGNGAYGVGKAAERYFGTTVQDLTLSQAAMLAGLLRAPQDNDPLVNPDNALARRDIVLGQMASHGFITAEQAEDARNEPLGLDPREPAPADEPFWVDWVTRMLYDEAVAESMGLPRDLLDALGETQDERIARVFQGGLRIHTTLDPELQDQAYEAIRANLTFGEETPEEIAKEPFGGIVSVLPGDGAITTLALGPREWGTCEEPIGHDDAGRELCDKTKFNPLIPAATGSTRVGRQPGSSFKPFLTTSALENGIPPGWTTETTNGQVIEGCEGPEGEWKPNNAGGAPKYADMYTGLKASSNVFHAKLIAELGPENVAETAARLGIFRSPLPAVCTLALGAVEVFPVEMAAAYATFANEGEFCMPYAITRIEDREGNLVYTHARRCEQAVDPDVIDRVVDIMEGPVTPGGTAPFMAGDLRPYPVRGKTGTTQDYRDAWFVGYVKQMATAAWIGYPNGTVTYDCDLNPERCAQVDNLCYEVDEATGTRKCVETRFLANTTIAGQYRSRVFGSTIPAPMWRDYMQNAVQRFEPESFPRPGPLPRATVPDLSEASSIAEMEELAAAAKLQLFVEEVSDYRPAGTFVSQSPEAGTSVTAGSAVVVNISDGTGEAPTVPDVVGMPEEEAVELLHEAGYLVRRLPRETDVEEDIGVVIAQDPAGGTTLPPGGEEGEDPASITIEVGVQGEGDPDDGGTEDPGNGNGGGNGNGNGPPEPSPSPSPSPAPSPSPTPAPAPSEDD